MTPENKMKCGACGGDKFEIYKMSENRIAVLCACNSSTIISPSPSKLKLGWGDNSKGILALFPAFPGDKED